MVPMAKSIYLHQLIENSLATYLNYKWSKNRLFLKKKSKGNVKTEQNRHGSKSDRNVSIVNLQNDVFVYDAQTRTFTQLNLGDCFRSKIYREHDNYQQLCYEQDSIVQKDIESKKTRDSRKKLQKPNRKPKISQYQDKFDLFVQNETNQCSRRIFELKSAKVDTSNNELHCTKPNSHPSSEGLYKITTFDSGMKIRRSHSDENHINKSAKKQQANRSNRKRDSLSNQLSDKAVQYNYNCRFSKKKNSGKKDIVNLSHKLHSENNKMTPKNHYNHYSNTKQQYSSQILSNNHKESSEHSSNEPVRAFYETSSTSNQNPPERELTSKYSQCHCDKQTECTKIPNLPTCSCKNASGSLKNDRPNLASCRCDGKSQSKSDKKDESSMTSKTQKRINSMLSTFSKKSESRKHEASTTTTQKAVTSFASNNETPKPQSVTEILCKIKQRITEQTQEHCKNMDLILDELNKQGNELQEIRKFIKSKGPKKKKSFICCMSKVKYDFEKNISPSRCEGAGDVPEIRGPIGNKRTEKSNKGIFKKDTWRDLTRKSSEFKSRIIKEIFKKPDDNNFGKEVWNDAALREDSKKQPWFRSFYNLRKTNKSAIHIS